MFGKLSPVAILRLHQTISCDRQKSIERVRFLGSCDGLALLRYRSEQRLERVILS